MSTDNASLTYELDATIGKFASSFSEATKTASASFEQITSAGRDAGDAVTQSINSAVESVANSFSSLTAPAQQAGNTIVALIGGGLIAAAAGIATTMTQLINTLASAGDRADDLRLPVNIIQALSVAADEARVPTSKLNSALDQFTSVSKKSADDAKDFYKALDNIGPSFGKAFQQAATQADRLRVLMNVFKGTTDEVKRAQLAQEAFGTDNERLISMFSGGANAMQDYINQIRKLGLEIDESAVKRAQQAKSQLSLLARVMTDELSSALAELIPAFKEFLPSLEAVAGAVRDTLAGFASPENRPLATLKNDAKDAEEHIAELENHLKELDTYKPSTGIIGSVGKKLGLDVYTTPDSDEKSGTLGGISLDIKQERQQTESEIAETKKALDQYKQLIAEKEKVTNANKGKDGTEAPAFKPRPKLTKDDDGDDKAFDHATASANKRASAMEADAATVGMTAEKHQQLRAEVTLLSAAQKDGTKITATQIDAYTKLRATMSDQQALAAAGIKLTSEQAEAFDQVSTHVGQAAKTLESAKNKFEGINSTLKFAGSELVNVFDQATQKGANFQTIMTGVLKNVEQQMLEAALTGGGAFGKLFGLQGQGGGVGGLLGGLAGLFGGARAGGGDVDPGKAFLVGEKGPEIFAPKSAGTIIPNHSLAIGGGSRNQVVNNHRVNVNVTAAPGSSHQDNQSLAEKVGRHVQDAMDAHFAKSMRAQTRPGGVLYGAFTGSAGMRSR